MKFAMQCVNYGFFSQPALQTHCHILEAPSARSIFSDPLLNSRSSDRLVGFLVV